MFEANLFVDGHLAATAKNGEWRRTTTRTTTHICSDDYADVIIGVRDGEYESAQIVDVPLLFSEFLEAKCRNNDTVLAITVTPIFYYHRGHFTTDNMQHRAIKITCNLSSCDYDGPTITNERFYSLWKDRVISVVAETMKRLYASEVHIFFRSSTKPEHNYVIAIF